MPLAKIHVVEGRYDESRMAKVSGAIQAALMNTLRVPPEDFYQLIFEFPMKRFLHTPSFVSMQYSDDLIILDLTFIEGRSKETRLALLKDVNTRVAAAAQVSPDDLMITLYEAPGENFSFGQARRSAPTPFRANRNSILQTRDQMPTYACSAAAGRLTPAQKLEIVQSITAIHHGETGAPRYFVQVIFYDIAPANQYIAGELAPAGQIWIRGDIRDGRTQEQRAGCFRVSCRK